MFLCFYYIRCIAAIVLFCYIAGSVTPLLADTERISVNARVLLFETFFFIFVQLDCKSSEFENYFILFSFIDL